MLPPHSKAADKKALIKPMTSGEICEWLLAFFHACVPAVHEALEEFGGPELVHLSDHTDPHVSVPTQQPTHVFTVNWREKKR